MKVLLLSLAPLFTTLGAAPQTDVTPAQNHIQKALGAISKRPDSVQAYNALAMAFAKRARETADSEYYERGLLALDVSRSLEPDNFGARRTEAWLLLGLHRFQEAMQLATKLNSEVPDDLFIYGLLVDAHAELGNYSAAEEACQWMLDLRPGNAAGLTRASYLRELFGDVEGALQMMADAYHGIHPNEHEDQAWILTQMAHLNHSIGRNDVAATLARRALELFPDYHYALAEMAKLQGEAGEHQAALDLLQQRYALAPHPENLLDVALAHQALGQAEQAAELFQSFEAGAKAESESLDNANRELALYLIEHTEGRAEEALAFAGLERQRRQDVYTLDTYAWALLANDRVEEARREIELALAVGQRDARLLFHAGAIALRAGDLDLARRQLEESLRLQPLAPTAQRAKKLLGELAKGELESN